MYGLQANRKGFLCCPFHREDTPSLKIYKDSYYCFGCGKGGDVFNFVMDFEGVSFREAYEKLGGTYINKKGKTRIQIMDEKRKAYIRSQKILAGEDPDEDVIGKKIKMIKEDIERFTKGMSLVPEGSEEWYFCQLKVTELSYELQDIETKGGENDS